MTPSIFRFTLYGLIAVGFYTFSRFYFGSSPSLHLSADSAQVSSRFDHSVGSLGQGVSLSDGRKSISRRTVAVADLHGDLEHARNVFRMASILSPTSDEWVAGHDVLVSTGDIVDRGDDTIALYRLFQSLRSQAAASGGQVRNLLGNHEVMNALGDWRYVTKGDIQSFGGTQERRQIMSINGWIGKDWIDSYNVTTIVPLLPLNHPALPEGYTPPSASFVHGGITAEYARIGIDRINTVGKSFLTKGLSEDPPSGWLPSNTTDAEKHLWSETGPLWYRGYATDEEGEACSHAKKAKEGLGVRHLVMGHTPHFDGFVVRCNEDQNSILLIDTGISRAYGGEQSALVIDLELTPINRIKDEKKLWKETETLTALYRGRLPKVIGKIEQEIWL